LANNTISPIVDQNQQGGVPMIDTILTDAIKRIEFAIKTNPEDYTDIYTELRELMFVIRTFRDFISNPTLERLENLEREMMAPKCD